jgi:hypothetical protein
MSNTRIQFGSCLAIIAAIVLSAMGICFAQPATAAAPQKCCPTQSAPSMNTAKPAKGEQLKTGQWAASPD